MKKTLTSLFIFTAMSTASIPSIAATFDIFQMSVLINSSTLGMQSLEQTSIGVGASQFNAAGLSVVFTNNLGANNLGTVTWTVTNNTGRDIANTRFFGFLDGDIDETLNTFFNETGSSNGLVLGNGSSDTLADSWEIDEPGFRTGNIFANLLSGTLDNTNAVPTGTPNDVSMALGFDVGTFLAGQTLTAQFTISDQANGGLQHSDPASIYSVYYNGNVSLVPVPGALVLMFSGLAGLVSFYRRRQ